MKGKLILFGIALFACLGAIYLIWPEWFGFCEKVQTTRGALCWKPYATEVGQPLLPLATSLLVFSLLALAATRKTFSRFLKFTVGYAIIVAILLFTIPQIGAGAGGWGITYIDTRGFAWVYAILYAVISLLLLGVSEFVERRKKS